MGIAFHPGFETNRHLFIYYTYVSPGTVRGSSTARPPTSTPNRDRLERYTLDENGVAIPGSVTIFIDQRSETVWHNGGGMFFHPGNGFLYLTNGDDARGQNNQRINYSLHSGVLRIDVDRRGGNISHPIPKQPLPSGSSTANYYIPNDNPFVGQAGALEEFFALGLRSPHRMTIDPPSGRIFIGDVGEGAREELDIIEPNDPFGLNFQWNRIEGLQGDLTPPFLGVNRRPVLDYPHSGPAGEWGAAIIGGYVYRGTEFATELGGRYVFGDNIANVIWVLDESTVPAKKIVLCNLPRGPGPNAGNDYVGLSGFGYDQDNELYMCQLSSQAGRIYKLQRGGAQPRPLPALLSQTGAFTDLATLTPASGLVHYGVNSPLWSDAAHKERWMGVPDGKKIGFATNGEWTFPAGSVWVKHFELSTNENNPGQRRRLETRLLVRDTNNYVYGASYRWRPDYSDADIVYGAVSENIEITGAQQVGELTSVDIGGPVAGSTTKLQDGWQLVAGGADIWGTSDQFRFAYQQRSGDFDVFVKVVTVTQTDLYTKAGLMVRDTLNANARHIFALVFPGNAARNNNDGGYEFQSRDTVGGNAAAIYPPAPSPRVNFPNSWLRLKRAGNVWTAYSSPDGRNWRLYATKALALPDTVYFGLALTAHTGSGAKATAKFDFREHWTQPWFFPGRQDCLSCHSPAAGGVLGVKTRQSNLEHHFTQTGVTDNQLRAWNHAGYFEPAMDEAQLPQLLRLVTVTNEAAALESRVRSYLDANCAHCHRPGGPAGQAKWDARIETPLGAAQILGGPVLDTLGVAGSRILVPKDLEHSVMYKRLSTATESYRMPPLAKNVVDQNAVNALAAWIQVLSGLPEVTLSSPAGGTLFRAPAKVVLTARASTTNGSIAKVEFYEGDTKLGEAWEPPYQATWNLNASGVHEVRALATDSLGVTGSSSSASFSVINPATGGLLGEYYDNMGFTAKKLTRVDSSVNFDWGTGSPAPEIGPETFSVRWTGTVTPRYSQSYTFSVTADDGVRLWVNNQLVINQWIDQAPTTHSGTITLVAGQAYPIRMDYYENGGGAVAQLRWRSLSQGEQIIPASQLRPPSTVSQPPSITVVAPAAGQNFLAPAALDLVAEVNDPNGDLAKVEFFADGQKLGETTDAPFRLPWPMPSPGEHTLTVQASDAAGTFTTATVNVTVMPLTLGLQPPGAGSTLALRAAALNGKRYRLDASANLLDWSEVSVQAAMDGAVKFPLEVGEADRFFRLVPLP
jgi:regulation of enolase protein 1 (concanavalin A-like superfamily)